MVYSISIQYANSAVIILIIIAEFQDSLIQKPPVSYNSICIMEDLKNRSPKTIPSRSFIVLIDKVKMEISPGYSWKD